MARPKAFNESEALEKAIQVFWKKGFNATSMEDLVVGMGINRASLYDTFGDKKQLYMAALLQFQRIGQRQNGTILTRTILTPKEKIRAILETQLEQSLLDPDHKGCFLANATAEMALQDPDVQRFVCQNIEMVEAAFEKLILDGQQIGDIRADLDARFAASFLTNYLHGLRIISKTVPDPEKMRAGLRMALGLLDGPESLKS